MASITSLLGPAFAARERLFDQEHESAVRLFNGFLEGFPALSIDLYARSILLNNYSKEPAEEMLAEAQNLIIERLPWVRCIVVKNRAGQSDSDKRGGVSFGAEPDRKVKIDGVCYSIDLMMNRDASLYLDTRNLRSWAKKKLGGKSVLNAFAYTGSLGVAALAGGAKRVVQLDRNRKFLNIAMKSYSLNELPVDKKDFLDKDFFPGVSLLKRSGETFDCALIDPPFFSSSAKGTVYLNDDSCRLINKVRPLLNDGAYLVSINNALFLSGKDYLASLEALCADGYLSIDELIPVPDDCTGFPGTRVGSPPLDPAPFNHSTKIAVLRVKRKAKSA